MPDIMMCNAIGCDRSNSCYRHTDSGTQPDKHMQSFWWREEWSPTGAACDNYWPIASLSARLNMADPTNFS